MADVIFPSNGSTAPGYLATPADGHGLPVVAFQEWWGLDDHIRSVCERLASNGFLALAPDLYRGQTTTESDEAEQKMMALDMEQAERDIRGAVDFLADHEAAEGGRVGSIGFGLGGGLSVWAAAANPKVAATVTYYYVMPHGTPDFSAIRGPVLGHFGTADELVPVEAARDLERSLRDAGVEVEFEFYEGAGHAFFDDTDRLGTYDEDAALRSWHRTGDFLRDQL